MKPIIASMHMHGNSARWLQVYKLKHGLGSQDEFINVVEDKFGENEYRTTLRELMELKQTSTMQDYIATFEDLHYQYA